MAVELNGRFVEGVEYLRNKDFKSAQCDSPARCTKIAKILDAYEVRDVMALRSLAVSEGGLISDELRRRAWPIFLGCTIGKETEKHRLEELLSWRSLPRHRDEDQVKLDVERSFIYYPHDQSSKELDRRKAELSDLITEVLRRHPHLSYFQGYHDICQVLLLVLGFPHCATAAARLSVLRIRDFMLPTLAPALAQLRLIPAIIYAVKPKLYHHLSQTQPYFALPGTLTMYAHDIQEYGDIARLFDILLAREAVFSVYVFAQIVLQRSDELFNTPSDEPEILHSILSKLPKPLDLETLILDTVELFEQYPPEKLPEWRSISQSSVLKTTRWPDEVSKQSILDGEQFFQKYARELQRAERREALLRALQKYRRPAVSVGLAILVGAVAVYLRRYPDFLGFVSVIIGRRYTQGQ